MARWKRVDCRSHAVRRNAMSPSSLKRPVGQHSRDKRNRSYRAIRRRDAPAKAANSPNSAPATPPPHDGPKLTRPAGAATRLFGGT
jgi:hypothetical protein